MREPPRGPPRNGAVTRTNPTLRKRWTRTTLPQVSDKAELAVKTRDIEKGVLWDTEGKWALKGAGTSFRGTVGDLHSENGQATIDIANGKHVKQIQFGETTSQVEGDAQHKSPLAVATEGVQKGDTISLSISRDGNSCTCKDFTRGTEVTVDRQGEVLNSRSFDPAKELAVPAR